MDQSNYQAFITVLEHIHEKPFKDCFYLLGLSTLEQAYQGKSMAHALKQSSHFLLKALYHHPDEPRIYLALAWLFGFTQESQLLNAYLKMANARMTNTSKTDTLHRLLTEHHEVSQNRSLETKIQTKIFQDQTFFDLLKKNILQEVHRLSHQNLPHVSPYRKHVKALKQQYKQAQLHLDYIASHLPLFKEEPMKKNLEAWIKPLSLLTQKLERCFLAAQKMMRLKYKLEKRLQQVQQLIHITRQRGAICTRYNRALKTLHSDCQSMLIEIDELSVQGYVPVSLLPIYARYAHCLEELKSLSQSLPIRALHQQLTLLYHKSLAS